MKKIFSFIIFSFFCLFLVACSNGGSGSKDPESLVIHYKRYDSDYSTFGALWLWPDGGDGKQIAMDQTDDYGVYAKIDLSEYEGVTKFGVIVKGVSDWSKDVDSDRYIDISKFPMDDSNHHNVYLLTEDENMYTKAEDAAVDSIRTCLVRAMVDKYAIAFTLTGEYKNYQIKKNDTVIASSETQATDTNYLNGNAMAATYSLGKEFPSFEDNYTVEVEFPNGNRLTKTADMNSLFDSKGFVEKYSYDGELGAIYSKESTTFRVWSPVAKSMKLRIYDSGTPMSLGGSNFFSEINMTRGEKGTWEYTKTGDCEGIYYTYVVTTAKAKDKEVVDPYAKSCGINGLRGMVVDFSKTNPEGWDDVKINEIPSTSLTVYETHIADLTSSDTWGGTKANAKNFKGFYESGTTYTKDGVTVKTGFDHIKELGVNAVQIIPVFDAKNEETPDKRKFNWGYDPQNYNSLDGVYSNDPYDGYARIKEFKELVQAYTNSGINIIMDVVYNHMNDASASSFEALVPGYYFRTVNGSFSNGSGCGNETASDRIMYQKFMVDSTYFWASEYKLGGFRFDLMGLHDVDTMEKLSDNLHKNISEYITVYGEPWTGGSTPLSGNKTASKDNVASFKGYGCFNDYMRDALIKGGMKGKAETGWITSTTSTDKGDVKEVKTGIVGLMNPMISSTSPNQAVQYVTCHDNYTLYDRCKAAGITDEATIKKMAMQANSVVFTSQGITFMLAGEEFLRTKGGNENSYNASYKVNELDYSLKIKNADMFANYQKLIALKHNANVLGLSKSECSTIVVNQNTDGSLLWYDLVDTTTNTTYRIAHVNGTGTAATHVVDFAGYTLYLDTENTGVELTATTQLENWQTIIAYKQN